MKVITYKLDVDYGQYWPLDDIMKPEPRPDWENLLSQALYDDLKAWAAFFNKHADWETGLYGSEELRRWFDLRGFELLQRLRDEAGHLFHFELRLWF